MIAAANPLSPETLDHFASSRLRANGRHGFGHSLGMAREFTGAGTPKGASVALHQPPFQFPRVSAMALLVKMVWSMNSRITRVVKRASAGRPCRRRSRP